MKKINSMNNTMVNGEKNNIVKMQESKLIPLSFEGIATTDVASILNYGRKEMLKTGKNWFVFDLPVDLIKIDDSYQRVINDKIIRAIMRNYDSNRVDVKLVNYRRSSKEGGEFYILDGQHTLTVEKELGHKTLTCKVFIGLSKKEEAMLFSKQNEFRRSITAFAQYKAEVVAGMEPAISIKSLCDSYNIEVTQNKGFTSSNTITSIRKCYEIVKKGGINCLDFTLQLIIELGWNNYNGGMNEKILSLYKAYEFCEGNPNNYTKLFAALRGYNPTEFVDTAVKLFRKEDCKTSTKCVEEFVKSIFY